MYTKLTFAAVASTLIAQSALADTTNTILADQPFKSTRWANGDYFTVTLQLDQCLLSKTVTEFDKNDTSGDSSRLDIDLSNIDLDRLELIADAVTLIASEGSSVICTDIVGEDCVVEERPGEQISVPASVDGATYLKAFEAHIAACQ